MTRFHPPSRTVSPVPAATRLPRRRAVAALGALPLVGVGCGRSGGPDETVSLDAARAALQAGRAILIDIREPQEHATGVAPGARLLPMGQIAARLAEIPADPARPVLLICHTQSRSRATVRALRDRGAFAHVRYVHGGMSEWARRGWPLVPPPR